MARGVVDLYVSYKFIEMLATPFNEWDAFELGLIDADGNTIKKPDTTTEKRAFSVFHVITRNIKRLLEKIPGGKSKLASYAAALFLLKESDDVEHMDIFLAEVLGEEIVNESAAILEAGLYTTPDGFFDGVAAYSGTFRIYEDMLPTYTVAGINLFEVTDIVTREKILMPSDVLERLA